MNNSTSSSPYTGSVPEHYEKYQGPVFFEPYALEVASRIDPAAVNVAVELACGTGRVTRQLRKALKPGSALIATDLSPDMLAVAKEKLKGLPIEWQVADAQQLPFADNSVDLVVCCFGYMFVPDKVQAFTEAYRVLRNDGRLMFTSWDKLELNGTSLIQRNVVSKYLGDDLVPTYKAAFAMNNDEEIKSQLQQAGFGNITIERVDKTAISPSATDVAAGLAQAGSMYNEIIRRNPDWVPLIRSELEKEIAARFGAAPMKSPMRALLTIAVKRNG